MPGPLFTNVIDAFTTVGKTICSREWRLELDRVVRPPSELSGFHSLEMESRTFSGARIVRILDAANSQTDEHAHDWPILSLHVVGTCRKVAEFGETFIAGPSAVLHGSNAAHANVVGASGLEQLEIQFDPAWAGMSWRELQSMHWWTSGRVASASMSLARMWRDVSASELAIAHSTRCFLQLALACPDSARPRWLDRVDPYLEGEQPISTREIARRLGFHPVWLARAYRAAVGEGMHETVRRKRVERALLLFRDAAMPSAQIAAEAGFCDQSHMVRCFRAVLGRTPREAQRQQRAMAS
jgi:AraC family transcriptional regulator